MASKESNISPFLKKTGGPAMNKLYSLGSSMQEELIHKNYRKRVTLLLDGEVEGQPS